MATTLPNTGAIIPAMTEAPDQAVNNAAFTAIDAKIGAHLAESATDNVHGMLNMLNEADLANNGWFKDKKTGLIIQWGRYDLAGQSDSTSNGIIYRGATVSLPITFPTACLAIIPAGQRSVSAGYEFRSTSQIYLTLTKLANSIENTIVLYIAIGY